MADRVLGYGNSIKPPRKLANFVLITKTTTKHVKNAWIIEIDFGKNMNKPNSDFVILDAFGQCKGLECFQGCQGTCLDPQNQSKQAGTRAASDL